MDGNWNLRLRRLGGHDDDVLVKSDVTAADEPGARSGSNTQCRAAGTTRHSLGKGLLVLNRQNRPLRCRNVLSIDRV